MKILSRYILQEIATFFGISLTAFTSVLLTIKMLQFASLIVDKGVELSQIATVFISIVPTFLEIAIPLSTLLGVMLAFARFSGDSELVVMRTSGISLYQIARPVLLFGVLVGVLGLFVSHYLKPWGYKTLSATLFEIARTKSTSGLEEGIFNKLGALTVYADNIDDLNGNLTRVLIDDKRDKDHRKIAISQSGRVLSDSRNRTIILELGDGYIHELVNGRYTLTKFATNRIVMSPDDLFNSDKKNQGRPTSELTLTELQINIDYFKKVLAQVNHNKAGITIADYPRPIPPAVVPENFSLEALKKKILRLKVERGQRFSLPFASFALALLALPLGVQPPRTQRTWGAGISASLGMAVFVFYYALFSIGIVLAQGGLIAPQVALWTPNVAVLLVALFALHKTASEQWQSIAQGVEALFSFVFRQIPGLRRKTA